LLVSVMEKGRRLAADDESLNAVRDRATHELQRLPEAMRRLETGVEPYPVTVSERLQELRDELASRA
jgi:hypothetical protein